MKKMGTSILITSLNDSKGKRLAQKLATTLNLHYADSKNIVEYDLFDSKAILHKCGVDYLRQRESEAMESIAMYDESVIYVDYDLFKNNISSLKNIRPKIYLAYDKNSLTSKNELNKIAFDEREQYLKKHCDLVVQLDGIKDLDKLLKEIQERL